MKSVNHNIMKYVITNAYISIIKKSLEQIDQYDNINLAIHIM